MSYLSIFRTNENQKQKWDSIIYEISEFVSAFFWDEAPDKYGLEAREGQQDMAFAILDAVRGNYHFAVEAGVGIGKSFAYLVPLLLYNKKTGLPVIIATSTIALQEQLMDDIKRLSPMLNVTPDVLLALSLPRSQPMSGRKSILYDTAAVPVLVARSHRSVNMPDSVTN